MIELPSVIPLTAIVALAIFITREFMESIRRFFANRRKRHALRLLLAAECEKNQWFIQWMRSHIPSLLSDFEVGADIEIKKTAAGYDRLFIRRGPNSSSSPVPQVRSTIVDRHLLEVASVDRKLFNALEAVATSLPILTHLRDGLIEHISEERQWLESWSVYALREMQDVEVVNTALYKICTGKPSIPPRIR